MNRKAIAYLRQGKPLTIRTTRGIVDLSQSSAVWGEGVNVSGLRWAPLGTEVLSEEQGRYLFGMDWDLQKAAAIEWAESA